MTPHDASRNHRPAGADEWTWTRHLDVRSSTDTTDEVRSLLGKLEAQGIDLPIVRLVANAPALLRPFLSMANGLMQRATLPPRVRELVVLHLGGLQQCEYELAEHRAFAARAGLTDEEIDRAIAGQLDHLDSVEAAAVAVAGAIARGERLPDGPWDEFVSATSPEMGLELLVTVAWWAGFVPTLVRGLALAPRDRESG